LHRAIGPDWAFSWGPQDDEQSIAAIRHAIDRGINWIDTAAVYGLAIRSRLSAGCSNSCRLLSAHWFQQVRSALGSAAAHGTGRFVGAPQSIRRECEESLRRLGVERIDLYQMHWPARDGTALAEYWQTLLELKQAGKVRAVGLSNHDVAQLTQAESLGHVDCLQPPFSAIRRERWPN